MDVKNAERRQMRATAPPGSGWHVRGDLVWHLEPSAGQPIGWVCTSSGWPGEWEPFGIVGNPLGP